MRVLTIVLLCSSVFCVADDNLLLTANQIMQRVAVNQDRLESLRRQYVYKQHIHVASRKTNGKLIREETADYDVFPNEQGSTKKLSALTGKYLHDREYLSYSGQTDSNHDGLDAELVTEFREDLVDEQKSKDGLATHLFPLTSKEQQIYSFKLLGEQPLNGRSAYHISFWPKSHTDAAWKGEAFIDEEDFQPVSVFTKLSRRVPFVVRTALGTDLPGVGFSVTYKRQADGTWFPSSFGTEFRLRALFFINRNIIVSLQNTDFEKTHVDSLLRYDGPSR